MHCMHSFKSSTKFQFFTGDCFNQFNKYLPTQSMVIILLLKIVLPFQTNRIIDRVHFQQNPLQYDGLAIMSLYWEIPSLFPFQILSQRSQGRYS